MELLSFFSSILELRLTQFRCSPHTNEWYIKADLEQLWWFGHYPIYKTLWFFGLVKKWIPFRHSRHITFCRTSTFILSWHHLPFLSIFQHSWYWWFLSRNMIFPSKLICLCFICLRFGVFIHLQISSKLCSKRIGSCSNMDSSQSLC